jgi:hypothetical protein
MAGGENERNHSFVIFGIFSPKIKIREDEQRQWVKKGKGQGGKQIKL